MSDDEWVEAWQRIPLVFLPVVFPWFCFAAFVRERLRQGHL